MCKDNELLLNGKWLIMCDKARCLWANQLYLAAGGASTVPALSAVDTLRVAVDSILRLGGVQQHLGWIIGSCYQVSISFSYHLQSQFISKLNSHISGTRRRPMSHLTHLYQHMTLYSKITLVLLDLAITHISTSILYVYCCNKALLMFAREEYRLCFRLCLSNAENFSKEFN